MHLGQRCFHFMQLKIGCKMRGAPEPHLTCGDTAASTICVAQVQPLAITTPSMLCSVLTEQPAAFHSKAEGGCGLPCRILQTVWPMDLALATRPRVRISQLIAIATTAI